MDPEYDRRAADAVDAFAYAMRSKEYVVESTKISISGTFTPYATLDEIVAFFESEPADPGDFTDTIAPLENL